uniref:Uncharacterized protein n=1 Tax=Sphenodon punctatus TaxID=8508 RepID=A0A8D0HRS6_SPHPU
MPGNAMLRTFRVTYKRHVLTMDDLQTLYGPNWLNDQVWGVVLPQMFLGRGDRGGTPGARCQQGDPCINSRPRPRGSCISALVMNMYGDLVMDTVPDKVSVHATSLLENAGVLAPNPPPLTH